jgi:hypothetical protein
MERRADRVKVYGWLVKNHSGYRLVLTSIVVGKDATKIARNSRAPQLYRAPVFLEKS